MFSQIDAVTARFLYCSFQPTMSTSVVPQTVSQFRPLVLCAVAVAADDAGSADPMRRRRARGRSVILLHQYGGPSDVDTFDMKPGTPPEFRGIYRPMQTAAPGIQICEKLSRLAPHMDKVTLVRTVRHEMRNHNSAG